MARFIVFILGTLLIVYSLHYVHYSPPNHAYGKLYISILKAYRDKRAAGFHYALLTGDKGKLSRKTKRAFRSLFLLHFLTPSGLHLGLIVSLLCLFSRKLLWATPLIFLLEGFYAAKRVLVLYYLRAFRFDRRFIFFTFFALDFHFGSFAKNPLSFSLSFLFLGIIYTAEDYTSLFFPFLGAQLLVSFFFGQDFSLVGFTLGFLLSPVLAATFPLYLTGFHWLAKDLSLLTVALIEYLSEWAVFDTTFVSLPLLMALFLLLFPFHFRYRNALVCLLILVHPETAVNFRSVRHLEIFPELDISDQVPIKRTKTGYKTVGKDGSVCYFRLRNVSFEQDCR